MNPTPRHALPLMHVESERGCYLTLDYSTENNFRRVHVWKCKKCGEENSGDFDVCSQCDARNSESLPLNVAQNPNAQTTDSQTTIENLNPRMPFGAFSFWVATGKGLRQIAVAWAATSF